MFAAPGRVERAAETHVKNRFQDTHNGYDLKMFYDLAVLTPARHACETNLVTPLLTFPSLPGDLEKPKNICEIWGKDSVIRICYTCINV